MPKLVHLAPALLLLCLAAAPLHAAPGGELGTVKLGKWFCELPGDAATPAAPVPAESFTTVPDSTYITGDDVAGSYLLLGDVLVMTTGTLSGHRFHLESAATVHRIDAQGKDMPLRCVRAGDPAANQFTRAGEPGEIAPAVKPAG
ncbi:hypothetical protein [Novosphingobium sp.]|uniref:hypothetical protein n=1 Tax=Novosphingobium sp. TaxID=1874826 RepID=UPI0025D35A63|nr:hypothetical protein [Novosphingobium sp.]